MDHPKKLTDEEQLLISFCSGSLVIEKGIEAITPNIRTLAYVEIEAFIIFNLVCAMETGHLDPAPIWTDLKTFNGERFRDRVHGITGGYPCQPFSLAGQQKGTDDERHLWPFIRENIRSIRPVWCFFENVDQHINLGFDEVYRDLREMGYAVEAGIFSASEVGAPHQRKRLFILAVLEHSESGRPGGVQNPIGTRQGYGPAWASGISGRERFDMAHTKSFRYRGWPDRSEQSSQPQRKAEQEENEEGRGSNEGDLDNSDRSGLEGHSWFSGPTGRWGEQHRSAPEGSPYCLWPAKPAEPQYRWEEPRAVESGVGCTVDGYNFSPELLRMYGNGVVEQVASKAWVMLWDKLLTENQ